MFHWSWQKHQLKQNHTSNCKTLHPNCQTRSRKKCLLQMLKFVVCLNRWNRKAYGEKSTFTSKKFAHINLLYFLPDVSHKSWFEELSNGVTVSAKVISRMHWFYVIRKKHLNHFSNPRKLSSKKKQAYIHLLTGHISRGHYHVHITLFTSWYVGLGCQSRCQAYQSFFTDL